MTFDSTTSAHTDHQSIVHTGHQPRSSEFVSAKQLKQLDDKRDERFARFEALLLRGNISTPQVPVSPPKQQPPMYAYLHLCQISCL